MDNILYKIHLTHYIYKSKKTIGHEGLRFLLENYYNRNAEYFISLWEHNEIEGEVVLEILERVNNKIPFELSNNGKIELISELKEIISDLIQNGRCIKTFLLENLNEDQLDIVNQVLNEIGIKMENANNKINKWNYQLF
jgi:hypothetical protein